MKKLENTTVIQKGNLLYDYGDKTYPVGTISKELLNDDQTIVYVFDLDKNAINKLKKLDPEHVCDMFIPGLDIADDGYYQVFKRLPFLVESRVIDRRRDDLQEHLEKYHMKEYDAFTLFLRSGGHSLDKLYVQDVTDSI